MFASVRDKLVVILEATAHHAKKLGLYVFLYKLFMILLRRARGFEAGKDPFIAGFFGGLLVFGEDSPISKQVCRLNLVLLSILLTAAIDYNVSLFQSCLWLCQYAIEVRDPRAHGNCGYWQGGLSSGGGPSVGIGHVAVPLRTRQPPAFAAVLDGLSLQQERALDFSPKLDLAQCLSTIR